MAALSRPEKANYEIHEQVSVDTQGKKKKDSHHIWMSSVRFVDTLALIQSFYSFTI